MPSPSLKLSSRDSPIHHSFQEMEVEDLGEFSQLTAQVASVASPQAQGEYGLRAERVGESRATSCIAEDSSRLESHQIERSQSFP